MSETLKEQIIVLKFGSSVLRTSYDLPNAVHEIYRWYRQEHRVVAVVSAIGDTTDQLLTQARALSATPESFATAELLATGERASAALLGLALDRAGVPARILNPREIGLTVSGAPLDSDLVSVDFGRLKQLLDAVPVLVVPGFFGTDAAGRTHCLGRGGSDLSAVFLAHALYGRCRLIKDVEGVFDVDPAASGAVVPRRYESLAYADALRVAGALIQPKAVEYLRDHCTTAEVAALARGHESLVYSGQTRRAAGPAGSFPIKALVLGLGTVGLGVFERLRANPHHFEVAGCLVREPAKYVERGVPLALIHSEPLELFPFLDNQFCEAVVIDALPGAETSRSLVERALRAGIPVVSANKVLIAECGESLKTLAQASGATLRYAAAVGGATPMVETVDRVAGESEIVTLDAVLNGTCNFILDACANGATLGTAIAEAQRAGFAETDATDDLSGRDAERKLRILCRHAYGAEPDQVDVECLDEAIAQQASELAASGRKLRQVVRATRNGDQVRGLVTFEVVERGSVLWDLKGEWNLLSFMDRSGRLHTVTGRGAGRWPTTEAIMADLYDVYRHQAFATRRR